MVELAWNRIKLEMKEQKITACALSKKTGIAVNTLKKILEYENDLIRVKTKAKTIKILGDKLLLKYITEGEIGIKGVIYSIEYVD